MQGRLADASSSGPIQSSVTSASSSSGTSRWRRLGLAIGVFCRREPGPGLGQGLPGPLSAASLVRRIAAGILFRGRFHPAPSSMNANHAQPWSMAVHAEWMSGDVADHHGASSTTSCRLALVSRGDEGGGGGRVGQQRVDRGEEGPLDDGVGADRVVLRRLPGQRPPGLAGPPGRAPPSASAASGGVDDPARLAHLAAGPGGEGELGVPVAVEDDGPRRAIPTGSRWAAAARSRRPASGPLQVTALGRHGGEVRPARRSATGAPRSPRRGSVAAAMRAASSGRVSGSAASMRISRFGRARRTRFRLRRQDHGGEGVLERRSSSAWS